MASVDKKYQIIVDAQVFGESQEHHTLKPILKSVDDRYQRLGIHKNILKSQIVVTADTGFSNEENDKYLKDNEINAYIPDNQFRSRDKKFKLQKSKYGKRHRDKLVGVKSVIPSSEFTFNKKAKTCHCPEGKKMWLKNEIDNHDGKVKLFFEGNLTDCRHCPIKEKCMRNPSSADTREGNGRQVSITYTNGKTASDWMRKRIDSKQGKIYYGHRMSVVEPVFGNISSNKGLTKFSLRGKNKVQGQWQLFSLVHNIEKIMNYGAIA
ncbi:transposase [Teredinibacter turnerae]|uniref:transposase n=1 Tax=Teredinibacter turnerae TaxID=2426 RepID=UPI0022B647DC|nr:transposase [Teredinibacter turnerae]